MNQSISARFCKNCGAQLPVDAQFCEGCGRKLDAPTSSPPNTTISPDVMKAWESATPSQMKALNQLEGIIAKNVAAQQPESVARRKMLNNVLNIILIACFVIGIVAFLLNCLGIKQIFWYKEVASKEMASNRYYSAGQHRGNTGEGQLHLKDDNIAEFSSYKAKSNQLADAIRKAYEREKKK